MTKMHRLPPVLLFSYHFKWVDIFCDLWSGNCLITYVMPTDKFSLTRQAVMPNAAVFQIRNTYVALENFSMVKSCEWMIFHLHVFVFRLVLGSILKQFWNVLDNKSCLFYGIGCLECSISLVSMSVNLLASIQAQLVASYQCIAGVYIPAPSFLLPVGLKICTLPVIQSAEACNW